MSILSIIQDAAPLIGVKRPASVINSADAQVQQLFALAIQEGMELNRKWWKLMTREQTFVTTATAEQEDAVPADLDRFWPNSFFNRTTRRPVLGPVTPQEWQNIQANPQLNRIVLAYRKRENDFLMTPTPPAGQTIGFEYISKKWARNSVLTIDYVRWQADTDTSYFDEYLITLGILWRWRKTKGLPYGEDYDSYKAYLGAVFANDGGSTSINITGINTFVGNPNIPETGFGQP